MGGKKRLRNACFVQQPGQTEAAGLQQPLQLCEGIARDHGLPRPGRQSGLGPGQPAVVFRGIVQRQKAFCGQQAAQIQEQFFQRPVGQIIAHTRQSAEGGDPGRKARLLQPLCPVRSGEVGLHIPHVVRNGQSRPLEALLFVGGGVRQIQLIHGHVPGPFRLPQGKAVIARPQDQVLPGAACGGLLQRLLSKGCTGQGQRPQLGVDDMGQGFLLRAGKIRREKADARRHLPGDL